MHVVSAVPRGPLVGFVIFQLLSDYNADDHRRDTVSKIGTIETYIACYRLVYYDYVKYTYDF